MDAEGALEKAAAGFSQRLAVLTESDWDRPSPCSEWTVRQVANHVVGCTRMYTLLLGGADGAELVRMRTEDHLGPDPLRSLRSGVAGLAAALSAPRDPEATVRHPAGVWPAEWLKFTSVEELTVHGWDVAQATGGDQSIDEEVAAWLLPFMEEMAPRFWSSGAFRAPERQAAPGGSAGRRLLHLTGRG